MISTVGRAYLTSNIENNEYSYLKAFSVASLTFAPIQNSAGRRLEKLDIRFEKEYIQNGGNPCKIRISAVFLYPFVAYLSLKSASRY